MQIITAVPGPLGVVLNCCSRGSTVKQALLKKPLQEVGLQLRSEFMRHTVMMDDDGDASGVAWSRHLSSTFLSRSNAPMR